MTSAEIAAFLADTEPFSLLPSEKRDLLAQKAVCRKFNGKEFIFGEKEQASVGYVVVSGRVAMTKSSPQGKELIVELLPAGELFGIVSFLQDTVYPLSARAQVSSEIIAITRASLQPLLKEHPELQQAFFGLITERMRGSHNLARALAFDRVETRVASVLIALIPKFTSNRDSTLCIEIQRQELADLCGITIETASRVMKAFERNGVVNLAEQGRVEILERQSLEAVIESTGIS